MNRVNLRNTVKNEQMCIKKKKIVHTKYKIEKSIIKTHPTGNNIPVRCFYVRNDIKFSGILLFLFSTYLVRYTFKALEAGRLKAPNGMTSWEFFDYLLNEIQVVGTPGEGFGACGEGHIRVAYTCEEGMLQAAVERLHQFCREVRGA